MIRGGTQVRGGMFWSARKLSQGFATEMTRQVATSNTRPNCSTVQ